MSITFTQFSHLIEMDDVQFQAFESGMAEGLSDVPGLGWLKNFRGKMNDTQLAQVKKKREELRPRRDAASMAKAKAIDDALMAMASNKKPPMKGALSNDDWAGSMGTDRLTR